MTSRSHQIYVLHKSHIAIDSAHGLNWIFTVAAANAHDGAPFANLVSRDNAGFGV
jgi:hypothetical protein